MTIFFGALVAAVHFYIFYLETVAWGRARTNRVFRLSEAHAELMRNMAFNQGFYNLFLAVAISIGLVLRLSHHEAQGNTLLDYGTMSVLGAGVVLYGSNRALLRPALIQGIPALAYLLLRVLGL